MGGWTDRQASRIACGFGGVLVWGPAAKRTGSREKNDERRKKDKPFPPALSFFNILLAVSPSPLFPCHEKPYWLAGKQAAMQIDSEDRFHLQRVDTLGTRKKCLLTSRPWKV